MALIPPGYTPPPPRVSPVDRATLYPKAPLRLFISGINPTATASQLAQFIGRGWDYRRLILPLNPISRLNLGYAFIDLNEPTFAPLFISVFNGRPWKWRILEVHIADERPPHIQLEPDDLVIFNLKIGTTEDDIFAHLGNDPNLRGIHVGYNTSTKSGAGIAFLKLRDRDGQAELIYQYSGTNLNGNVISIRTARKDEKPQSRGAYTLDIPGLQDLIRIPALEDIALRAQRTARAFTHFSTLPNALNFIPPLINMLDDAQDLLFTALVLAKPLFRRLPARIIPGLGWLLITNDVLNLLTGLLSVPLTGRPPKRAAYAALDLLTFGRARRIEKFTRFMSTTQWVGFTIQGAQALRNVSEYLIEHYTDEGRAAVAAGRRVPGYGLSLGAVMGLASEAAWAPFRMLGGNRVIIRLPPPADPLGKALRFLEQTYQWPHLLDALAPEDHVLLTAAQAAAVQIIATDRPAIDIGQADANADNRIRAFRIWNPASAHAIATEFFSSVQTTNPWYIEQDSGTTIFPGGGDTAAFNEEDIVQSITNDNTMKADQRWAYDPDRWQRHADHMRTALGNTPTGTWTSMAALSSAMTALSIDDPTTEPRPNFAAEEIAAMHAIEFGLLPVLPIAPAQVGAWLARAVKIAKEAGQKSAQEEHLIKAARQLGVPLRAYSELNPAITEVFEGGFEGPPLAPGITPPGPLPP